MMKKILYIIGIVILSLIGIYFLVCIGMYYLYQAGVEKRTEDIEIIKTGYPIECHEGDLWKCIQNTGSDFEICGCFSGEGVNNIVLD